MMKQYYFFKCALPSIKMGEIPEISFEEFLRMVDLNISGTDKKQIDCLRQYIDIKNLRPYFLQKNLDTRGTLSAKELEEALLVHDFFPPFVFAFMEKYDSAEERLKNFAYLYSAFFRYAQTFAGFLASYFSFERDLRLIIAALRAKVLKKDIVQELQFEDMQDDLVVYILVQRDSPTFDPPAEYAQVKEIFEKFYHNPLELELRFSLYRQEKIEELTQNHLFSIEGILGYMAQLWLAENWVMHDPEKGKELIQRLRYG